MTLSIDTPSNVYREGDSSEQQERISPPLLTVNLIPYRPLLGAVVDLTLNFVVQKTISIKIQETGTLKVVIGECTYRPARISLPFVNRSGSDISAERDSLRSWNP